MEHGTSSEVVTIRKWYTSNSASFTPRSERKGDLHPPPPYTKALKGDDPLSVQIMELGASILCSHKKYSQAKHGQRQLVRITLANHNLTNKYLPWSLLHLGTFLHRKESYSECQEVMLTLVSLQRSKRIQCNLSGNN
jgi:hypothetical protein